MVLRGRVPRPHIPRCPMLPLLLLPLLASAQQVNIEPLFELLRPESMSRMASIATELSSLAANNMRNSEKQVKESEMDAEIPIEQDSRPSRLLGAAAAEISNKGRNAFIEALAPLAGMGPTTVPTVPPRPDNHEVPIDAEVITPTFAPSTSAPRPMAGGLNIQRLDSAVPLPDSSIVPAPEAPSVAPTDVEAPSGITRVVPSIPSPPNPPVPAIQPSPRNPLGAAPPSSINPLGAPVETPRSIVATEQAPNALLRIANAFLGGGGQSSQGASSDGSNVAKEVMSLGLRDFMPNADSNFGIPKGKGCLPFLSEFMQAAYGNCQQVADERAFDAWGNELKSAILTGQIDILKASQETCRRGAERQQCASLRRAIADCDIMKSLTVGAQLQRAMQRCEDVGGLIDQDPMMVLGQLNRLIGGEVAQGFFNNFLGGKPSQ